MLAYPFVAVVVTGLASLYKRFLGSVDETLASIRGGAPALTAALTRAVELGAARPMPQLPAPASPLSGLSSDERGVVDALASGLRPKQLAHAWGVSLATVRKHISHAKRKTGARTLPELAAIAARSDRPPPEVAP
jgi:DNA-binding CsgD family transcriptional regulator